MFAYLSLGIIGSVDQLAGALQAAIYNSLDGHSGLAGWRWMFVRLPFLIDSGGSLTERLKVVDGIITMIYALAGFWLIPDFPTKVKYVAQ